MKKVAIILAHTITIIGEIIVIMIAFLWYLNSAPSDKYEPLICILGAILAILASFFFKNQETIKRKNIATNIDLTGKNIHVGDNNKDKQMYDEKNVVKGSKFEAEGDIHIGDK